MRPMVEFCVSNLSLGSETVKKILEEENEVDVLEYGCLGNCGQCFVQPYALVNGKLIVGEDAQDLLKAIRTYIEKVRAEDEAWRELGF
ncbi:YuzB family protein [Aneurinibacillus migulanus]|uniref:YuzB family protein n=1 Tax=Aneurinibacillus migulanus TaxID=47500 RepID=UPI002E1A447C|nr:YuzB family protein [Aneurinibacillus migulanus]